MKLYASLSLRLIILSAVILFFPLKASGQAMSVVKSRMTTTPASVKPVIAPPPKKMEEQGRNAAVTTNAAKPTAPKQYRHKKRVHVVRKDAPRAKTLAELQEEIAAIQSKIAYIEQEHGCTNPQREIATLEAKLEQNQALIKEMGKNQK